jgi:hypothetical protein
MPDLLIVSGSNTIVVNSRVERDLLFCGLLTIERFAPTNLIFSDITTGQNISIELPDHLSNQPMMQSVINQKLKITPKSC